MKMDYKEKLKQEVKDYLKEEFDLFDFNAEYDNNLTLEENRTIIFNKIKQLFGNKEEVNKRMIETDNLKYKEQEQNLLREQEQNYKYIYNDLKPILKELKSICVVGETGAGKTALCYYLLDLFKRYTDKELYVYKFPKPELLKPLGIKQLYSIEDLINLRNAVILLTEPQITLPKYDKRNNDDLQKILSLARHRDITIILDTSDTGYINRRLESYIQVWFLKDIEYYLVKQGSIIRKIIKDNTFINPREFRLNKNEFVFYSREFYTLNRKWEFLKPSYFCDELSKAFN